MKVTRGNVEGNKEEGNQHAGLVKNTDNSDNYAFDLSSESEGEDFYHEKAAGPAENTDNSSSEYDSDNECLECDNKYETREEFINHTMEL